MITLEVTTPKGNHHSIEVEPDECGLSIGRNIWDTGWTVWHTSSASVVCPLLCLSRAEARRLLINLSVLDVDWTKPGAELSKQAGMKAQVVDLVNRMFPAL